MKSTLVIFSFMLGLFLYSQEIQVLDTTDYSERKIVKAEIDNIFKKNKAFIKEKYKRKLRKELVASYNMIQKELNKKIRKKELYFHPKLTDYISNLTSEIITDNPEVKHKNYRVFLSRQPSMNAVSIVNGLIILNIGLFKYLDNEAQIASVISHEIAHLELNHSKNSIIKNAKNKTSKEFKKKANSVKYQKYNKHDKAIEMLRTLLYADMGMNRSREMEADSLGYLIFSNTKYPPSSFVKSLEVIARYDSLPNATLEIGAYKKWFDLPTQAFKQEWLNIEKFDNYNYDFFTQELEEDSLLTHPSIVDRIMKLKQLFPLKESSINENYDNSKFEEIHSIAKNEDVANLNYLGKYGLSIYYCLIHLEHDSSISYYRDWIGKNFKALYKAKKNYQFNRYVDIIKPNEQDESYQRFIGFLWNLNLTEIKNIGDYYSKTLNE